MLMSLYLFPCACLYLCVHTPSSFEGRYEGQQEEAVSVYVLDHLKRMRKLIQKQEKMLKNV